MTDRTNFFASTSAWMKKDLYKPGEGEVLTIRDVRDHRFQNNDGTSENKLVIDWKEERPSLTLNKTNFNWLVSTFGGDDDKWVRQKVYVWHDPTISYGGRRIGGLLLDAPTQAEEAPRPTRGQPVKAGPDPDLRKALNPRAGELEGGDSDIPF